MDLFTCCRTPGSAECRQDVDRTDAFRKSVKILLLGTGESGKSTVLKQMKILHVQGFSEREKKEQVTVIRQNLSDSLCEILRNIPRLGLQLDEANSSRAQEILQSGERVGEDDYVDNIEHLLEANAFRECMSRANEYQLMDNAEYFLRRASEISCPAYCPTIEDILRSRTITTGYHEVRFHLKVPRSSSYYQEFRMFDVGGQREERRKWIHVFEGIEALLFVLSCSDYDQTLREDGHTNRLVEAIELFRRVWHNGMLAGAGIICFLNKQDLLEQKIRNGHSIAATFPEYEETVHSMAVGSRGRRSLSNIDVVAVESERTRDFIKGRLLEVTNEVPRRTSNKCEFGKCRRECYFHCTTATDSENIRRVFNDVHNMILQQMLVRVDLV